MKTSVFSNSQELSKEGAVKRLARSIVGAALPEDKQLIKTSMVEKIIENRTGYRNNFFGESEHESRLKKILEHEIFVLGNYGTLYDFLALHDDAALTGSISSRIKQICRYVAKVLKTDKIFSVWLTTLDAAITQYSDGDDNGEGIIEFKIPESFVVVDALPFEQGVLFSFKLEDVRAMQPLLLKEFIV